jgi:hypothetical protein
MDEFPPKPPKGLNPDIAPFPKKKYSAFYTFPEFPSSFRPDFPTKIQAMSRIYFGMILMILFHFVWLKMREKIGGQPQSFSLRGLP